MRTDWFGSINIKSAIENSNSLMASKKDEERMERIENALLLLAGGAVGRAGLGKTVSAVSRVPGVGPAAGIGLGLEALQTDTGQMLLDLAEERGRKDRLSAERLIQDTLYGTKEKVTRGAKKAPSKFNKAVSKAQQAIKNSKSYGPKGRINRPQQAFKVATRMASAAFRGKKAPKSGPTRTAYMAAKKVYKDEILRRKMK
jgi:hypothetical protein